MRGYRPVFIEVLGVREVRNHRDRQRQRKSLLREGSWTAEIWAERSGRGMTGRLRLYYKLPNALVRRPFGHLLPPHPVPRTKDLSTHLELGDLEAADGNVVS